MKEIILTDEPTEKITAKWDGERLAIIKHTVQPHPTVIVLNAKEASELYGFIEETLIKENLRLERRG